MDKVSILLRGLLTIIITFIVFNIARKLLGKDIGGVPDSFKAIYQESYFVKNDLFIPAVAILMTIILVHLLLNYLFWGSDIKVKAKYRGIIYGFLFGMSWFIGFLELPATYLTHPMRYILSGIRDLISLSAFGVTLTLFPIKNISQNLRKEFPFIIVFTSLFFALFHGVQYNFTLKGVVQDINIFSFLWLLIMGAWIGVMYYFLSPSIKNIYLKAVMFALNIFGLNWILYTSFYNLFLDIPIKDLLFRCFMDIAGVSIGIILYEIIVNKKRKSAIR